MFDDRACRDLADEFAVAVPMLVRRLEDIGLLENA